MSVPIERPYLPPEAHPPLFPLWPLGGNEEDGVANVDNAEIQIVVPELLRQFILFQWSESILNSSLEQLSQITIDPYVQIPEQFLICSLPLRQNEEIMIGRQTQSPTPTPELQQGGDNLEPIIFNPIDIRWEEWHEQILLSPESIAAIRDSVREAGVDFPVDIEEEAVESVDDLIGQILAQSASYQLTNWLATEVGQVVIPTEKNDGRGDKGEIVVFQANGDEPGLSRGVAAHTGREPGRVRVVDRG